MDKRKRFWSVIAISAAILSFVTISGILLVIKNAVPIPSVKYVWNDANRIVLLEAFSQDSTNKYAEYCYDSGVLGYTAVQKSYVSIKEKYPIRGNVGIQSGSTEFNSIRYDSIIIIKGCEGDVFDSLVVTYEKKEY